MNDASTPVDYGVFGGTIPYGHDSDCRYVPRALPPADVPDSVDRLLALGAPASVLYDFTLARFLRDRGIDPEQGHPPDLPVEDRGWYAQLTMQLLALPFSDEPEWRERWRP